MTYTEKVILLTEKQKLKPYGLAKKIGVSPNTVANWFKNKKVPCRHAVKIADFFGIGLRSLMDDEILIEK